MSEELIFTALGPSGAGKTTLLSCMHKKFDHFILILIHLRYSQGHIRNSNRPQIILILSSESRLKALAIYANMNLLSRANVKMYL